MIRKTLTILLLVSLLALSMLLALFAWIVAPMLIYADSAGMERLRASAVIISIQVGLETFMRDVERYPTPTEGLSALLAPPTTIAAKWNGPYIEELRDPWGRQIEYHCPGKFNRTYYDLWSNGPNGIDEHETPGSDDVKNWR